MVAVNTGNVAQAVNEAVEQATTKWVVVFSHDCVASPAFLEGMLAIGFAADVVYPDALAVDETLSVRIDEEFAHPFCPHRLMFDNYVPAQSLILRQSFLDVGGLREQAAPWETWDLFVRGWRAGWRFKPAAGPWFYRRIVEGSRTREPFDRKELQDRVVGNRPDMQATFYYQATHACAYLRAILPARYMPAVAQNDLYARVIPKKGLEGEPQTADDIEAVEFPLHHGKASVLQFAGDSTWALCQHHMQEQGIRCLVEVDDNYLSDPGKIIRGTSNWGVKIGDAVHSYQGHRYIASWADGVIVTTEKLADAYRKVNPDVFVIPNPVDPVDWEFVKRKDDGVFRIGWFASPSHYADAKLVARAFEWASRQKDVEIVTLGFDPKWKFKYTPLPWVNDLDMYRLLMGHLDVGVCPVIPSPFSIFRSDIKASEYNMGGAAVICSDVPPYSHRVHEQDCLKAGSAKDFFHHVKRLVQDRDETAELAKAGRAWVDEHRNIHRLMPLWEEALQVKKPVAVAA